MSGSARIGCISIALFVLAACSPVCGGHSTAAGNQDLVFSGPAAGTLTDAESQCTHFPSAHQANFHFDGMLGSQQLALNIQVHSGYDGPGTYAVGSLLDGAGEVRLQVGTLDVSSATGAGSVTVNTDGKSGSVTANLSGGERVHGTFVCAKLQTG